MPDTLPHVGGMWFAAHGYPVLPLHSLTEAGSCTCGDSLAEARASTPSRRSRRTALRMRPSTST